jgi:hypothetical protein
MPEPRYIPIKPKSCRIGADLSNNRAALLRELRRLNRGIRRCRQCQTENGGCATLTRARAALRAAILASGFGED